MIILPKLLSFNKYDSDKTIRSPTQLIPSFLRAFEVLTLKSIFSIGINNLFKFF